MKVYRKNKFFNTIIFFVFFLSIIQFSFSQNTNTDWWSPDLEKGLQYLEEGEFQKSETEFESILQKDKKIPQAYYGLGLLYDKQEPGSKKALNQFEKAVSIDPAYAEGYYGMGLVYLHKGDKLREARESFQKSVKRDKKLLKAWIGLAETEQKLHQQGPAMKAYAEAVKLDSNNPAYYSAFIASTYLNSNYNEVLKTLQSLKNLFPKNPEYDLATANIYYRMRDYAMSSAILKAIKIKHPEFSPCRILLLQAKINFDERNEDDGLSYYWSAVNTIKTQKDAQAIFDDVCYIMNDAEYNELRMTPLEAVWKYYYRFWRKRDPNLATKKNERIVEHYRRLAFALRNYRRFEVNDRGMKFVYATQHPYYQYNVMGDDFWKESYWPLSMSRNREVDDMGLIYIRHGEPDQKVTSLNGNSIFEDPTGKQANWEENPQLDLPNSDIPGMNKETSRMPQPTKGERISGKDYRGNMPQNMSWKYFKKGKRPEMIFHFEKHGGTLGWIIEAIPFVLADRHDMDPELQQLEQASYSPLISPRARSAESTRISNLVKQEDEKFAKIALTTETTDYKFEEETFNFPYQVLSFKGEKGQNLVEIYYMLSGMETQLKRSKGGGILDLTKYIGFFDNKWNELVAMNRTDGINLPYNPLVWSNYSIVDVERFQLSPGEYNLEMQLKDNTAKKVGDYKGKYISPNYNLNHLALSDILLSSPIKPKDRNSKFSKGNIIYNPRMFSAFKRGSTVGVYFEVYNLSGDKKLDTHFRVTCTLKPFGADKSTTGTAIKGFFKNLLGKGQGSLGTSYDYSGKIRDEKIYLNFELNQSFSGRYELEVEVVDLNAQLRATKKVPITIAS